MKETIEMPTLMTRCATIGLCMAAATATVGAAPASAASSTSYGPPQRSFLAAKALTLAQPDLLPQGVNDWNCHSATHPRPVILVHGTFANSYDSFAALAPALESQGYCVFTTNYGISGAPVSRVPGVDATAAVKTSVNEIGSFIATVRARTGAAKVDMFGWSQGGIVIRGYLKLAGGANPSDPSQNTVANVVTYGATNHGTSVTGLLTLARLTGLSPVVYADLGQAVRDQEVGSDYLNELNAGGDTMPGVSYTVIGSQFDEVTTPYRSTFLAAGPDAKVSNVTLQDGCSLDASDHLQGMYSPRMISITERALGSNVPILCRPNAPVL